MLFRPTIPSFFQPETANTHIFLWPELLSLYSLEPSNDNTDSSVSTARLTTYRCRAGSSCNIYKYATARMYSRLAEYFPVIWPGTAHISRKRVLKYEEIGRYN